MKTKRQLLTMVLGLLLVAGIATQTSSCASGPELPIPLGPRQTMWKLYPGNPIIKAGDFRDKGLWNDPSVLKVGDTYVMWLTSSIKDPFKPPVVPFRAVSKNGVDWHLDPPRPLMDPSGTPFLSMETPSVVYFHGQYHMYYMGIYPAGHVPMSEIGHAASPDGIHWTKDPKPVITSSGKVSEWTGFLVAEPGAIVYKGKIYMYFTALGARPSGNPPQLQTIGLAVSDDGYVFDKPRPALPQSKLYPPEEGFPGYSTPAALVDGDTIHLFYCVVHYDKNAKPDWRAVALAHAVSKDGGLTFVEKNGPLLRRQDLDWSAKGEVQSPAALIDGNEVKLWFFGHVGYGELGNMIKRGYKGREFGIGLMTTDLASLRKEAE
jgi:hypothetical protein